MLGGGGVVYECCLRLERSEGLALSSRPHFLGYAARTMRSIVVEPYPSVMKSSRALPSIRFRVCRARSARVSLEVLTAATGASLLDASLVVPLVSVCVWR